MLLDIIGVFIAFAVTMLLLSLIVTAMSQAIQAVLRLRGRNLRYGLASAIGGDDTEPTKKSYQIAAEILNRCDDAALQRQAKPTSGGAALRGPAVSWLEPATLKSILESAVAKKPNLLGEGKDNKTVEDVVQSFERLDKPLRNRFELVMRGVSVVWALVIAGVFQVSTPHFVQELSTDSGRRAGIIAAAQSTLQQSREVASTLDNEDLSKKLLEVQVENAISSAEISTESLALIDFTPMRHGTAFYTDFPKAGGHILGVLMTAILLMLGAPFWYRALETAVKWRDIFAHGAKAAEDGKQKKN